MTPLIATQFGIWTLGTLGVIDLIAATTNAFNGALLARRPDHYKHFTLVGVIVLAYVGGIGGGVIRDVLCNKVPSPLINPWYLIACFAAAGLALLIDYNAGQRFKDGLFQFMTAFSLPWYAIVGAPASYKPIWDGASCPLPRLRSSSGLASGSFLKRSAGRSGSRGNPAILTPTKKLANDWARDYVLNLPLRWINK